MLEPVVQVWAMANGSELENALSIVRSSPDHIVLERVVPRAQYHPPTGTPSIRAVYLDTETTGIEPDDAIIELAVVAFDFDPASGRIFSVAPPRSWLEDPGRAIPDAITAMTGITDQMVRGCSIPEDELMEACDGAELIIAHNASFDRPLVERRFSWFSERPWACSQLDVGWNGFGYSALAMDYLIMKHGRAFHDGHRAESDAVAGVHVLASPFADGTWPMKYLYAKANLITYRVRAVRAPFDAKDMLKARGYRWDAGDARREKAWWIEVATDGLAAEQAWLARHVYPAGGKPVVEKLTARERYSARGR